VTQTRVSGAPRVQAHEPAPGLPGWLAWLLHGWYSINYKIRLY